MVNGSRSLITFTVQVKSFLSPSPEDVSGSNPASSVFLSHFLSLLYDNQTSVVTTACIYFIIGEPYHVSEEVNEKEPLQ